MLCLPCRKIFLAQRTLDRRCNRYIHHVSRYAFRLAATSGCRLCVMLLGQLSPDDWAALAQPPEHMDANCFPEDHPTTYSLHRAVRYDLIVKGRPVDVEDWWYLRVYCMCPAGITGGVREISCRADFVNAAEQSPLADSSVPLTGFVGTGYQATSFIRRWIQNCDATHNACKLRLPKRRPRPAFSRIIDVTSGRQNPRLCEADTVPAGAFYMTLSHCWGGVKPLELKSSNYDELKKEIEWGDLPKTFADAITFSRQLGVSYLWIDSLCIKQDDEEDWAEQARVMGDIYAGSFLNIAATGAENPHGGLFHKRNTSSIPPLRVFIPKLSQLFPSQRKRVCLHYYDVTAVRMWEREVEQTALCGRGWVFQERVLSPRCLHFGKRQLFWECPTLSACETYPDGIVRPMDDDTLYLKSHDPLDHDLSSTLGQLESGRHAHPPPFLSIWGRIVEDYTKTLLSRDSDKLMAVAGMAKVLGRNTRLDYLAGLWARKAYGRWFCNIPNQLLWRTSNPAKRPQKNRAPSWSWAAVDSPIRWQYDVLSRVRIRIEDIRPSDKMSKFSQFEQGLLSIRGDLVPAKLCSVGLTLRDSLEAAFFPDCSDNAFGPVLCTTIAYDADFDPAKGLMDLSYRGLVLQKTGKKGVLRRLGLFTLHQSVAYVCDLSRNVRLLDHTTLPSTTDPLEGIDEDCYLEYTNIDNGGGLLEDINEKSFRSWLTPDEFRSMRHRGDDGSDSLSGDDQRKREATPEGAVESESDLESGGSDSERISDLIRASRNVGGRNTWVQVELDHRRDAVREENTKEPNQRTFGAFRFEIM